MTNNESWLYALRTEPAPAFQARLRARLRIGEPPTAGTRHTSAAVREWPRRLLPAATGLLALAVLLSAPGVRTAFAQFLSLFRVTHIVAVRFDPSRLERLHAENLDIGVLAGEQIQILQDPGPPARMASLDGAAAAAGMSLALPQWLPEKSAVAEIFVAGDRALRITANSRRLQQVMDALGIHDLSVPAGLDGQTVDIRVPPVVTIRYEHGTRRSRLVQARSPQIALPAGIDLRALGEIGLRILGLDSAAARQFANAIDWHSTLLVPVPPNASSFRQVTIGGRSGVHIQHQPRNGSPTQTVIWSTPERVFVLLSTQSWDQTLAMADSIR